LSFAKLAVPPSMRDVVIPRRVAIIFCGISRVGVLRIFPRCLTIELVQNCNCQIRANSIRRLP
jgi:hypothetical protein